MSRGPASKKGSPIRERVRALPDAELAALITALRFNTKLEQATLNYAVNEQRRRAKASGKAAEGHTR